MVVGLDDDGGVQVQQLGDRFLHARPGVVGHVMVTHALAEQLHEHVHAGKIRVQRKSDTSVRLPDFPAHGDVLVVYRAGHEQQPVVVL